MDYFIEYKKGVMGLLLDVEREGEGWQEGVRRDLMR